MKTPVEIIFRRERGNAALRDGRGERAGDALPAAANVPAAEERFGGNVVERGERFRFRRGRSVGARNPESPNFRRAGNERRAHAFPFDFQRFPRVDVECFSRFAEIASAHLRDAERRRLAAHRLRRGNENFLLRARGIGPERADALFPDENFDESPRGGEAAAPDEARGFADFDRAARAGIREQERRGDRAFFRGGIEHGKVAFRENALPEVVDGAENGAETSRRERSRGNFRGGNGGAFGRRGFRLRRENLFAARGSGGFRGVRIFRFDEAEDFDGNGNAGAKRSLRGARRAEHGQRGFFSEEEIFRRVRLERKARVGKPERFVPLDGFAVGIDDFGGDGEERPELKFFRAAFRGRKRFREFFVELRAFGFP